jgi:hypothetical protein
LVRSKRQTKKAYAFFVWRFFGLRNRKKIEEIAPFIKGGVGGILQLKLQPNFWGEFFVLSFPPLEFGLGMAGYYRCSGF